MPSAAITSRIISKKVSVNDNSSVNVAERTFGLLPTGVAVADSKLAVRSVFFSVLPQITPATSREANSRPTLKYYRQHARETTLEKSSSLFFHIGNIIVDIFHYTIMSSTSRTMHEPDDSVDLY